MFILFLLPVLAFALIGDKEILYELGAQKTGESILELYFFYLQ